MKVFVLEDDPNRIETIKNRFGKKANFIFTVNIQEAKEKFNPVNENYDLIMLDHDLGGQVYVDSKENNTGAEFCRWILKNKFNLPQVIIHSHNIVGAEIMEEYLIKGGHNVLKIPFGNLINLWDKGLLNFLGTYKYDG